MVWEDLPIKSEHYLDLKFNKYFSSNLQEYWSWCYDIRFWLHQSLKQFARDALPSLWPCSWPLCETTCCPGTCKFCNVCFIHGTFMYKGVTIYSSLSTFITGMIVDHHKSAVYDHLLKLHSASVIVHSHWEYHNPSQWIDRFEQHDWRQIQMK